MEGFVKGDVVVLPFPFTNLRDSKKRPALVVASLKGADDIILCQITSKTRQDRYAVVLQNQDLKKGTLNVKSVIRPNRLFTADSSLILYKLGTLKGSKIRDVERALVKILTE